MSVIDEKYDSLQYLGLSLGEPITDEILLADGSGACRDYENGSIYYHPDLGAFEVEGAILGRYRNLGAEQSSLGYPVTDEEDYYVGDTCTGRQNEFSSGTITWTPTDGAIENYADSPSPETGEQSTDDTYTSEDTQDQPEEQYSDDSTQPQEATIDIDNWLSSDYPVRQLTVSQALQVIDHLINQSDSGLQIAGNAVDQTNVTKMHTGNGVCVAA